jgi:hypothetical protein
MDWWTGGGGEESFIKDEAEKLLKGQKKLQKRKNEKSKQLSEKVTPAQTSMNIVGGLTKGGKEWFSQVDPAQRSRFISVCVKGNNRSPGGCNRGLVLRRPRGPGKKPAKARSASAHPGKVCEKWSGPMIMGKRGVMIMGKPRACTSWKDRRPKSINSKNVDAKKEQKKLQKSLKALQHEVKKAKKRKIAKIDFDAVD